jgi:hypothetical protein
VNERARAERKRRFDELGSENGWPTPTPIA